MQLAVILLLAGCSTESQAQKTPYPTAVEAQPTVVLPPSSTPLAADGETATDPSLPVLPTEPIKTQTPTSTATFTPLPPAAGTGISPLGLATVPSVSIVLTSTVEWRPPPLPVPLSLHPDDHYWLSRPIASDRRNYDLEWYPYGNEPMLSSAQPYRVHHGMDFPNDTGTPIFAAAAGTVIHAGPLPSSRNGVNYYGNTVVILLDWRWQGEDVYTLYAHTLELFVEVGDHVDQGQLIAGVGASGEVSGPHLHLELRVAANNYANTRNPALWLVPYQGWGTLAGRFIDELGRFIHGAQLTVIPDEVEGGFEPPIRRQRTYSRNGPNSDEVWRENFVVADLPAGFYTVLLRTSGATFRREVQVKPGQTNFIVVQADFVWSPTVTPTPSPTLRPTTSVTPTLGPPVPEN